MISRRVLICSAAKSVGGFPANIGDEALTGVIADTLMSFGYEVHATLAGDGIPVPTTQASRLNPRNLRALVLAVRRAELVVLGGGTLLAQDAPSGANPLRGLPRYCLTVALLCWLTRTPLHVFSVGAQDWNGRVTKLAFRAVLAIAETISVRDADSASYVRAWTGASPVVTGDAYLAAAERRVSPPLREAAKSAVVAISGRDEGFVTDSLMDAIAEFTHAVTILRMDQTGEDDEVARRLETHLSGRGTRVTVAPYESDWASVRETLRSADAVIASRLHALIMAGVDGRPLMAVGKNPKVLAFCRDFGCPAYTGHGHLNPRPIEGVQPAGRRVYASLKLLVSRE